MYWLPTVAFFASGILLILTERAYFNGLASSGSGLHTDLAAGEAIRRNPRDLPRIVVSETRIRLGALWTHQSDPIRERQRYLTLLFAIVTLACFIWASRWV